MRTDPLEKEIQAAIVDYLTLHRHFFWRNNTGAYNTEHGAFVRFGAKGSPDIILVFKGRAYLLKVKRKSGRLSPFRKRFQWVPG